MKNWLACKLYKWALAAGFIPKTHTFTVSWKMAEDGKCYITTPFLIGRDAYTHSGGHKPGDTGKASIELIIYSDPSQCYFAEAR